MDINLFQTYERERAGGRALALAVVMDTDGSTYSKRGAAMLITAGGECAGLLSGGCVEADLREHAHQVIKSGAAKRLHYDARAAEDLLFGMGSGCEGAMDILLTRVDQGMGWQPFVHWQDALAANCPSAVGFVVESTDEAMRPGAVLVPGSAREFEAGLAGVARQGEAEWLQSTTGLRVLGVPLVLPRRILLLGAGPDAEPLAGFAAQLGWQVTIYDHRPALADAGRFPATEELYVGRPDELGDKLSLGRYDAAVVMSHHLQSDAAYLRVLASSEIGYVGLLGPAPRRDRLRAALGAEFSALQGRLRAPVGLDLGGRSSAAIALAVIAEIQAWLHERSGRPFSASSTA